MEVVPRLFEVDEAPNAEPEFPVFDCPKVNDIGECNWGFG